MLGTAEEGLRHMASSGKKKTTMAKLARENRLRERRLNKKAKKDARKLASADHFDQPEAPFPAAVEEPSGEAAGELGGGAAEEPGGERAGEPGGGAAEEPSGERAGEPGGGAAEEPGGEAAGEPALRAFLKVDQEPSDPRAKEAALMRLRDSRDEELAVFEGALRDDAVDAGATEQEVRDAQRGHPGHGG